MSDPAHFADVLGLSEEAARQSLSERGIKLRIVELDGEGLMMTMDYCTSRLNVAAKTTDNGKIITALKNFA